MTCESLFLQLLWSNPLPGQLVRWQTAFSWIPSTVTDVFQPAPEDSKLFKPPGRDEGRRLLG